MDLEKKTEKIIKILQKEYPRAKIALNFSDNMQLLVAVILSAQSTDVTVNKITPAIFKRYKTAGDYARADIKTFEKEIYSAGFYHNKAKNITAAAKMIRDKYNGKIPRTMEQLLELPGVARKTANIVLYNAYGITAGIAVDTHVRRLVQRLGLTKNDDPVKIEQELLKLVPQKLWGKFSYLLIDHGRQICMARKPKCPQCAVNHICPSFRIFYPGK
jgi:endonuclease III